MQFKNRMFNKFMAEKNNSISVQYKLRADKNKDFK